jgi:DNA (cytosine-5)-methyltransferase 1
MYGLDLFSGIGGITKALEGYITPIAYCERDRYAIGVLLSRMHSGDIPTAPVWDDVLTLHGAMLPHVDIICGGFPCQDISIAGRGKGLAGKRSGLFFQILRLMDEIRPVFVFLENVPNIRTKGLAEATGEFSKRGYDCRWICLSAAEIGAPHKRERWFLLAYADRDAWRFQSESGAWREAPVIFRDDGPKIRLADPLCEGLSNGRQADKSQGDEYNSKTHAAIKRQGRSWWAVEPDMGRVAHGVPLRVDRLRALGNAVVPAQAREAFERLMGINQ